jgi:hypothetical protein
VCNGSGGEQLVAAALDLLKLQYISQYSLPGQTFKYDFATGIKGMNSTIEWDGGQHFRFIEHFHSTQEEFLHRRDCDCQKTKNILNLNCKMIRIDHTWSNKSVQEIAQFIYNALQSNELLILSNSEMYQWLTYN